MRQLLIATKNAHKTAEIRSVLRGRFEVGDLCSHPEVKSPEETGETFSENASIKALSASRLFGGWVLADDSGLCVDVLGGAPGVNSARYAGVYATDAENRLRLLDELKNFPNMHQRVAHFRCVLVLAKGGEIRGVFEGVVNGAILTQCQGAEGFGYDSIFLPDGHSDSFGVLSSEVKNAISHRARALDAFLEWLAATSVLE